MAKITGIPRKIEESFKSEAYSLVEILKKTIPEHTHVLPLIYALELLLLDVIITLCKEVPQFELHHIIRGLTDEILATHQRVEDEVKDTPDENQEPQPQL